jgi:hypothetical protein
VAALDGAHRAVDTQGVGHVSTLWRGFRRDLLPKLFNASNAAEETMNVPQAEISNNVIKVQLYVPDLKERAPFHGHPSVLRPHNDPDPL